MALLEVEIDPQAGKELLKEAEGFGGTQIDDLIAFLEKVQPRMPDLVICKGLLSFVGKGIIKGMINKGIVYLIQLLKQLKTLIEGDVK